MQRIKIFGAPYVARKQLEQDFDYWLFHQPQATKVESIQTQILSDLIILVVLYDDPTVPEIPERR